MSFADLKSKSQSLDTLISAASKEVVNTQAISEDRFWKPEVDKAGNGYAVLRFLPAPEGENIPWVKYWSHGFKGPNGQWFIENCRTSLNGEACPACESNNTLWNSGNDDDKVTARQRKRRLHYISNVFVVSDPANPQNEGKVMLFKYGKKIFDKLMDVMQPQFADEKPINPFDLWVGADFKLKIRQVEGYRNYDKSEFSSSSELLDGDESALESVYNRMYSLNEFIDPSSYKSYAELKTRLVAVLGESGGAFSTAEAIQLDTSSPVSDYEQSFGSAPASTQAEDSGDDALSYFAKLANS